jgi:hypothetical protein
MEISKLKYYANFVFLTADVSFGYATTDVSCLRAITNSKYDDPIHDLGIGRSIKFPSSDRVFKITDIKIRQIVDDTDFFTNPKGFDSFDYEPKDGEYKIPLFKVLIEIE